MTNKHSNWGIYTMTEGFMMVGEYKTLDDGTHEGQYVEGDREVSHLIANPYICRKWAVSEGMASFLSDRSQQVYDKVPVREGCHVHVLPGHMVAHGPIPKGYVPPTETFDESEFTTSSGNSDWGVFFVSRGWVFVAPWVEGPHPSVYGNVTEQGGLRFDQGSWIARKWASGKGMYSFIGDRKNQVYDKNSMSSMVVDPGQTLWYARLDSRFEPPGE